MTAVRLKDQSATLKIIDTTVIVFRWWTTLPRILLFLSVVSNSPLFGDGLALSDPGVLEVVGKLVPEHEDVTGDHLLLSRLRLHPEVARHVLETERRNKVTNSAHEVDLEVRSNQE